MSATRDGRSNIIIHLIFELELPGRWRKKENMMNYTHFCLIEMNTAFI